MDLFSWVRNTHIVNEKTPTISFYSDSMGNGGAQRTIANLATGFSEKGYIVNLLLLNEAGPYLKQLPSSVSTEELPANRAMTSIPYLVDHVQTTQPDIFFSTREHLNISSLTASLLCTVETDFAIRISNIRSKKANNGLIPDSYTAIARLLYPRSDNIISLSEDAKIDAARHYALSENSIEVIHNPVKIDEIQELSQGEVPDIFSSEDDFIISVGSLSEQKDMETLIKAMYRVRQDRDTQLIILGEGERRNKLQDLVLELNMQDVVHMPGFVNNPFPYVHHSDVFALSSRWEGFGHVIVESMACGTPVVVTDCPGGPAEILNNGEHGILVPVGDEERLAQSIKFTLNNSIDPQRLINRARKYDYRQITSQYEKILFDTED